MDYEKLKQILLKVFQSKDLNIIKTSLSVEERIDFIESFYGDENIETIIQEIDSSFFDYIENNFTHFFTSNEAKTIIDSSISHSICAIAVSCLDSDEEKLLHLKNESLEFDSYDKLNIIASLQQENVLKCLEDDKLNLSQKEKIDIINNLEVGKILEYLKSEASTFDEQTKTVIIKKIINNEENLKSLNSRQASEWLQDEKLKLTKREKTNIIKKLSVNDEELEKLSDVQKLEWLQDKKIDLTLNEKKNIIKNIKERETFNITGISEEYKQKLEKLKNQIDLNNIYMQMGTFFSEEMIDSYGNDFLAKIYKYMCLSNNAHVNTEFLIEKKEQIKYLYSIITGKLEPYKQSSNMDLLFFQGLIRNFERYGDISQEYLKNGITEEKVEKLKKILETKEAIEVKTVEDIDNVESILQTRREKELELVDNIGNNLENNIEIENRVKNLIYLMLCNQTSKDVEMMRYQGVKFENLENLKNTLSDENAKELAGNYATMLNYMEYIYENHDLNELKENAKIICSMGKELEHTQEEMRNLFIKIKSLYSLELNQELTQVDELGSPQETKIASNIEIAGEKLDGKQVPYYELGGEGQENYIFLSHVMYDFGNFGQISDWKNPKMKGSTHLSLSLVDGEQNIQIGSNKPGIDGVTILFDKVDTVIAMDNTDIASHTEENDLNVYLTAARFDTTKNTLKNTSSYNEYIVYRDDIKPSGIRVRSSEPTQDEIDAAAYLGVPLIKLNPAKRKKETSEVKEKEEHTKEIKNFSELIQDLNKDKKELLETQKQQLLKEKEITESEYNMMESNETDHSL